MKKVFVGLACLTIFVSASVATTYGGYSKYLTFKDAVKEGNKVKNPDGTEVNTAPITFKENKSKDKKQLKNFDQINGFVSDEEISKKGGKYISKKLMTYGEYVELGIDDTIRHDIDENRYVWVFVSKFDKTHYVNGRGVEKAIITTVFDAESGESISMHVSSDSPTGLDELRKHKK